MTKTKYTLHAGIDTGGTFTDVVVAEDGQLSHFKLPSQRERPAKPVQEAMDRVLPAYGTSRIVHGSTVATNAVLERAGGPAALVITAGFEDILAIGRQNRRNLYRLSRSPDTPLFPPQMIFPIRERTLHDGRQQVRPKAGDLVKLALGLSKAGVKAVALCFLHSYINPANETFVAEFLEKKGFITCCSCEVLREYREFERCSTTALNAYLQPVKNTYYADLGQRLKDNVLSVMHSGGGSISSQAARRMPVQTVLSGPAGGVVAAHVLGRQAGYEKLLTLDMGGTSTDVSIIDGTPLLTTEAQIDNMPIGLQMIDIVTVGAGGGSIARLDEGGALRVGPESAGADPGPVCYGRGDQLTVTDAHLYLGAIPADMQLGGSIKPQLQATNAAIERYAQQWNMEPVALAEGIIRVAEANMERALRVVSVERGRDARDFSLFAFGGAGGLHACRLAEGLRIRTVVVPNRAGVLSALGMLLADAIKDVSRTVLLRGIELQSDVLDTLFDDLAAQGTEALLTDGYTDENISLSRSVSMRYVGQSFELEIPWGPRLEENFHARHRERYGHADESRPVEIVTARLRAMGRPTKPEIPWQEPEKHAVDGRETTLVNNGRHIQGRRYDRAGLNPGAELTGPAIVHDSDSTVLIPPEWTASVDGYRNLVLQRKKT